LTPDVALLEDGFTDVTASDLLATVDDEGLSSRLVFFTASVACGDLARAMATGACGTIPMNAKPDALVQSLRLEKPGSDLARIGNEANGIASFGNNVLALLTVNERTIMDLVAEGLLDGEIARVLQSNSKTFEDRSAAGRQHAQHDPQADDLDMGKPQHKLSTGSGNSANDAHSTLKDKTGGKDGPPSDDANHSKSAVGTELGDSFHFKNGANNAPSDILDLQQLVHGSEKAHGDGQHAAAHEVPVQDAQAINFSAAQHDHAGHANHHAAHDLVL
jgi:FixJ family two-component response regulator